MGARAMRVSIMDDITLSASIIDTPIMDGFIMNTCKLDISKVDSLTLGVSTMNSSSHNRYTQSGYI